MMAVTQDFVDYARRANRPLRMGLSHETVDFMVHMIYHLCAVEKFSIAHELSLCLFDCMPAEVPGMAEVVQENSPTGK